MRSILISYSLYNCQEILFLIDKLKVKLSIDLYKKGCHWHDDVIPMSFVVLGGIVVVIVVVVVDLLLFTCIKGE